MAENPVFWSSTTVIVDRRNGSLHTLTVDRRTGSPYKLWVDSRNGSLLSEILSSRRMQAVREIRIWSWGLSEEGWRNVAEHPGLKLLEVWSPGCRMEGVDPELVGRVVTSKEGTKFFAFLSLSICFLVMEGREVFF